MPWYRSGTVSVTTGQTTVTGASTDFALNSRVGDAFQGPDGQWYEVANIASSSVLSILPAYQGPTVSAGSYGLAPMQGYVKESADRLRQLVEQFGSTLALLGTPADAAGLRQNIGAATSGANSDIISLTGLTTALSIAQGGTGATTAAGARAALGLKSAAAADILGTVSQVGGVPSGAIIENGSNANGRYTKFADGTMICRHSFSAPALPSGPSAVGVSWAYPATFAATPVITPCACSLTGASGYLNVGIDGNPDAGSVSFALGVSIAVAFPSIVIHATATGRWF